MGAWMAKAIDKSSSLSPGGARLVPTRRAKTGERQSANRYLNRGWHRSPDRPRQSCRLLCGGCPMCASIGPFHFVERALSHCKTEASAMVVVLPCINEKRAEIRSLD